MRPLPKIIVWAVLKLIVWTGSGYLGLLPKKFTQPTQCVSLLSNAFAGLVCEQLQETLVKYDGNLSILHPVLFHMNYKLHKKCIGLDEF